MKNAGIASFVAALLLAPFVDIFAQETPQIVPGSRLRVSAPTIADTALIGNLERVDADSLLLKIEGRAAPLAIPMLSVKRIDMSRGRKTKAGTGAAIGFLTGAATGAVLFEVLCTEHDCTTGETVGAALLGGVALSGIGVLIGAFIHVDRWEEVPLERVRMGISTHGSGFLFSASFTF